MPSLNDTDKYRVNHWTQPWAHSPQHDGQAPHLLSEHLPSVADLAANRVAAMMVAAPESPVLCPLAALARIAGMWHDIGKYRPGMQRHLKTDRSGHLEGVGGVAMSDRSHSAAGAIMVLNRLRDAYGREGVIMARSIQYVIAGHHAGLADWDKLNGRLSSDDAKREYNEAMAAEIPAEILRLDLAGITPVGMPLADERMGNPGRYAMWVRMLLSVVVDADFADTERYMNEDRAALRASRKLPPMADLRGTLAAYMARKKAAAKTGPVNDARALLLRDCLGAVTLPRGTLTLTAPTGAGKTLASLSLALGHAEHHGMRRVIYAIPYTSITEQTSDVFRSALGESAVLEHHSAMDSRPGRETVRARLATENWGAPLIVTTTAQLMESLFATRTSRTRKLHNIAGSVIVIDEAQLLPAKMLQPVVDALRYLVDDYGCTVVLTTATQPPLSVKSASADPRRGIVRPLAGVREVVQDVPTLFAALSRVRVHRPGDRYLSWSAVAADVVKHGAALAVVNSRADALALHGALVEADPDARTWHLSASMCGAHRSVVIAEIRAALDAYRANLDAGRRPVPVRVVSTRLIECGVDVDFPVVYRAMAGLDSIAQTAGRCNREGRLTGAGDLFVIHAPGQVPQYLQRAHGTACAAWANLPNGADPLGLAVMTRYFADLQAGAESLDEGGIAAALAVAPDRAACAMPVRFAAAAEAAQVIEDGPTVIVPYGRNHDDRERLAGLISELDKGEPSRRLMRQLQRYSVTVRPAQLADLMAAGAVTAVEGWDWVYVAAPSAYDDASGLRLGA